MGPSGSWTKQRSMEQNRAGAFRGEDSNQGLGQLDVVLRAWHQEVGKQTSKHTVVY